MSVCVSLKKGNHKFKDNNNLISSKQLRLSGDETHTGSIRPNADQLQSVTVHRLEVSVVRGGTNLILFEMDIPFFWKEFP